MKANDWDTLYGHETFVYGQEPNDFLKEVADQLPQGPALCLAEGEGRNAVFLAQHTGLVTAVDQSQVGLQKAVALAQKQGVQLQTQIADLKDFSLGKGWSVITSIWAHVPSEIRAPLLQQIPSALAPGGAFVLESYTPKQIGRGTGGPPDPDFTTTLSELKEALSGLEFAVARELEREVHEGDKHNGLSSVVQVLALKPQ